MKLPKIFGALATAAVLFASAIGSAAPANYVDGVDWSQKVITVRGVGIAPKDAVNEAQARGLAEIAAKSDALRKMAEIVNGVKVDAETTVEKMLTTRDVIKTRVSATIKGAQVIDGQMMSDGTYVVVMQVPIFGVKDSLAGAVFEKNETIEPFPEPDYEVDPSVQQYDPNTPVKRRVEITAQGVTVEETYTPNTPNTPAPPIRIDPTKPALSRLSAKGNSFDFDNPQALTVSVAWSKASAPPTSYESQIEQRVRRTVSEYASLAKGNYTGLVIDCRGMELQPVMSPVVKNSNGTKIYGHKNLDIDKIIEMGMADYTSNIDSMQRAGDNPLVVKAAAVENFNSNPVLKVPDSNRVLIENHATKFLADLKVVFLFDN